MDDEMSNQGRKYNWGIIGAVAIITVAVLWILALGWAMPGINP